MNLSSLQKKYRNVLGPSSIAVAISENTCRLNIWLQLRYKSTETDSIFIEKYKLKHQSALTNLIKFLSQKYPTAIINSEKKLPVVNFLGVSIFGIPDIILKFPETNEISIYDVKTGARKTSHFFQIAIYYLMVKAIAKNKGLDEPKLKTLGLCYESGESKYDPENYYKNILEISGPKAIDEIFLDGSKDKLREILSIASQDKLPESDANSTNCRFCKFKSFCPDSEKEEELVITNEIF